MARSSRFSPSLYLLLFSLCFLLSFYFLFISRSPTMILCYQSLQYIEVGAKMPIRIYYGNLLIHANSFTFDAFCPIMAFWGQFTSILVEKSISPLSSWDMACYISFFSPVANIAYLAILTSYAEITVAFSLRCYREKKSQQKRVYMWLWWSIQDYTVHNKFTKSFNNNLGAVLVDYLPKYNEKILIT